MRVCESHIFISFLLSFCCKSLTAVLHLDTDIQQGVSPRLLLLYAHCILNRSIYSELGSLPLCVCVHLNCLPYVCRCAYSFFNCFIFFLVFYLFVPIQSKQKNILVSSSSSSIFLFFIFVALRFRVSLCFHVYIILLSYWFFVLFFRSFAASVQSHFFRTFLSFVRFALQIDLFYSDYFVFVGHFFFSLVHLSRARAVSLNFACWPSIYYYFFVCAAVPVRGYLR